MPSNPCTFSLTCFVAVAVNAMIPTFEGIELRTSLILENASRNVRPL